MSTPARWELAASRADVRRLEELAGNAWPAAVVQHVDGWWLRWGPEGTFRTRSVWPNDVAGDLSLAARLDLVTRFYADRGLPARVQISPAALPEDLDARLAERGFAIEKPTHVLVADRACTQARPDPTRGAEPASDAGALAGSGGRRARERDASRVADAEIVIAPRPDAAWIDAYGALQPLAGEALAQRTRLFERIGPRCAFARASDGTGATAVGFAVIERGCWGLYSLAVREDARRRGLGAALVSALGAHAEAQGARHAYLQVEAENEAALALYARLGYRLHHAYHYRTAPERA